ncbi:MAG: hypothetical protein N3A69_07615 [Leptospiraceae bacterium]|nr:hypothetical protein [Leptospiraceae bacterium]
MEKFKLTTILHKTRENGSIVIKDIVNETLEFNRNFRIQSKVRQRWRRHSN